MCTKAPDPASTSLHYLNECLPAAPERGNSRRGDANHSEYSKGPESRPEIYAMCECPIDRIWHVREETVENQSCSDETSSASGDDPNQ